MKLFKVAVASAALAGAAWAMGASSASAQAPVSWTGFYVGANAGYAWRDQSVAMGGNDPATQALIGVATPLSGFSPGGYDADGAFGGFQFGYNWQFAPQWLVGIEADIQLSSLSGRSSSRYAIAGFPFVNDAHDQVDWFGTVRGRLGFLMTPNLLLYGTGGFAYGRVEQSASVTNASVALVIVAVPPAFSCVANAICAAGSRSDNHSGWTAGGGFEYLVRGSTFLGRPLTLKAEYQYISLGNSDTLLVPTISNPAANFTATFHDTVFHTVRIGLNVRL